MNLNLENYLLQNKFTQISLLSFFASLHSEMPKLLNTHTFDKKNELGMLTMIFLVHNIEQTALTDFFHIEQNQKKYIYKLDWILGVSGL